MSILNYINDPAQLMLMVGIRLFIIFLVLPIHECAHAFAAKKMGDNTAVIYGRLTLNPFAHIDIFGAIFLMLFGFGWAKPVPINPIHFKKYRKGIAITAAAGPLSNLICATIGIFVVRILSNIPVTSENSYMVLYYIMLAVDYFSFINLSLAVFNMIPIPPLDGSRILGTVVSNKVSNFMQKYQQYIYIVFLVLLFTDVLQVPMSWIINKLYAGIDALFFWVEPLFGLLR